MQDVAWLQRSEAAEAGWDVVVGIKCTRSLEMMVHFLVNNMKQNPLKVRAQSLRISQARMFTGAERWGGIIAQLHWRQLDIWYWISKPPIV